MVLKLYGNPENAGWLGWIENGRGTAVAFVKLTGEIVWKW